MKVRTREIPPEQEFILKDKKFEHILSWSILLIIIGCIAAFLSYFVYANTQNLYISFMLWSNIFSFFYILAIHSPAEGKNNVTISFKKIFKSIFGFLPLPFIILVFILILYSTKGVYGIFMALNSLLIIYVLGSALFFLGKLFIKFLSGELQQYIKSKLIFREDFNLLENIELRTSKNIEQSMKYYNSKKLKDEFQSYLFWKEIKNAFNVFLGSLIIFSLYSYIFYSSQVSNSTIITSGLGIGIFGVWVILSQFLSFFVNKRNIQIKTLSLSPKSFTWSEDKNTLYLK